MTEPLREPMGLKIYRVASRAAEPVAKLALNRRLRTGKEDADRIDERRGVAGMSRPDGELIWIHGASVGESLSVLPLVKRLNELKPDASFLVTTGTVTSAKLMAERLPERAIHQYVPLDHPDFVDAFLNHWRPDAALFVESEFWPNLMIAAKQRAPFLALINGRISPKSFANWQSQPNAIKFILSSFDLLLGQDRKNAERLRSLSGRDIAMLGNLKNAAPPLPVDERERTRLFETIAGRPCWLAASTHPGEEEIVASAHRQLKEEFPELITIVAPRHPARGDAVEEIFKEANLSVVRRTQNGDITDATDAYVADTLGELGLFYSLCDIAFVGGSITPKGGHNPLEPARLGVAILHGPETFNFVDTYQDLRSAGGAALVRNDRELAGAARRLLADDKTRAAMAAAAKEAAEHNAQQVLDDIIDALKPHLLETPART
jgi:3-deoxy-D-manno-octulosonic-acid transferase